MEPENELIFRQMNPGRAFPLERKSINTGLSLVKDSRHPNILDVGGVDVGPKLHESRHPKIWLLAEPANVWWQDNGRAKLVGARTYGKAVIQTVSKL